MIGALIGDLAAWSWENDKELFYTQLVSYDIKPSVYGRAFLNAASRNLLSNQENSVEPEGKPYSITYNAEWLMWTVVEIWQDKNQLSDMPHFWNLNFKEAHHVRHIIYSLVYALRNGTTKSEAFHIEPLMHNLMKVFPWRYDVEPSKLTLLSYVFRAWDSFYRGFDFTSSIHNAMKWTGDKHLLGTLTGVFADAMYGCEFNLIKEKYAKGKDVRTQIPILCYTEHHGYHYALAQEMMKISKNERTFFPKNQALTNVERHQWKPVSNPFDHILLTKEQRDRILLSAPTNWECRYGLYLDDGWIYSYRSGVLIGRFQLKEYDGIWRFDNLQLGERNFKELCMAMNNAIYEGCGIPLLGKTASVVSALKYYKGEIEMPEPIKDTVEGKFWHGERMFVTNQIDMDSWTQSAQSCLDKLTGERKEAFSKYAPEQRAITIYIETLYGKFCPYDDFSWIWEY